MKSSGEQYDDRIVEVHWDPSNNHWRMMRFRDDKPNGNHQTVVENIIQSIADGVEKDTVSPARRAHDPYRTFDLINFPPASRAVQRDQNRMENSKPARTGESLVGSPATSSQRSSPARAPARAALRAARHVAVEQSRRATDSGGYESITSVIAPCPVLPLPAAFTDLFVRPHFRD